MIVLPTGITRI